MHQKQASRKGQGFRAQLLYEAGLWARTSGQLGSNAQRNQVCGGPCEGVGPTDLRALYTVRLLGRSPKISVQVLPGPQ